MTVPLAFVFKIDEGIWKSVVEPMLFTENKVENAPVFDVEPIAKSVVLSDVDAL